MDNDPDISEEKSAAKKKSERVSTGSSSDS